MSTSTGPLYECTYDVRADVRAEFEEWLRNLQSRALLQSGIESAHGYQADGDDSVDRFVFQLRATDNPALDALLDGFFADAEGELADAFGEAVTVDSRVLREDASYGSARDGNPDCLNCGTRLRGQYCGNCGQRSRSRLISIWQLLKEAFGDLFEFDSRLWRTVVPLMIRPGQLTRDYLEGRRARYMPPFRTYLVLSVLFFVIAFFDPRDELSLFFEPEPAPTAEEQAEIDLKRQLDIEATAEKRDIALEKMRQLEAEGKLAPEVVEEFENDNDLSISFGAEGDDGSIFGDCDEVSISDGDDVPEWLSRRFSDERLKQICERNNARGNDSMAEAILDNIPVALIVLLPVMALVLKILYPLSRRYFVEHLLFFVHFHAFFFLILILQILFARLAGMLGSEDGVIDSISTLVIVASSFYIPVYLYRAMRHVYGQGHLVTIPKYLLLTVTYTTGATMTMLMALLVAILSA